MSELRPGSELYTLSETGKGQGWRVGQDGVPMMDDQVHAEWTFTAPKAGSRPSRPPTTPMKVARALLTFMAGALVALMIYSTWDGNDALMRVLLYLSVVFIAAVAVVTVYERRLFRGRLVS